MPWWLLGMSMVATTFSTDTPNLVTDIVRRNGVAGNWVWWAMLLTGMLTTFVYAKLWRRSGVLTDLEFYEPGGYVAQRMLAARDEKNAIGATLFFNVAHYALRPWPWIVVALCSLVVFPDLESLQQAFPHIDPKVAGPSRCTALFSPPGSGSTARRWRRRSSPG